MAGLKKMTHTVRATRAAKIFCLDGKPPLEDGVILFDSSTRRILRVGPWDELRPTCEVTNLGNAWITPGIFNCHTHLELSGQQSLQPAPNFCEWARQLQNTPKIFSARATENALADLQENGTAFVADFCGGKAETVYKLLQNSALSFCLFLEYLGWRQPKPRALWQEKTTGVSVAAHSLYGVSPEAATTLHRWTQETGAPFALHISESAEEETFFATGGGELANMLGGRLIPKKAPVAGCSSLVLANRLGLLGPRTLLIHCARLKQDELALLRTSQAMPCLCPRSNAFIGAKNSPAQMLLEHNIPFCLGTDSLASNTDLNLWNEVLFLTKHVRPSLSQIFDWTIRAPARFFGLEHELGSLTTGKKMVVSVLPEELRQLPYSALSG